MTIVVCVVGWTAFLLALAAWRYERSAYEKLEASLRLEKVARLAAKEAAKDSGAERDLAVKRAERAEAVALAMVEGLDKNEQLLLSQSKINEGLQRERDEVWKRYEVTTMQLANGQDMLKRQVQALCLQLQSKGEKPVLLGDVQRMLEESEKV